MSRPTTPAAGSCGRAAPHGPHPLISDSGRWTGRECAGVDDTPERRTAAALERIADTLEGILRAMVSR